jgi:hypothetical protein
MRNFSILFLALLACLSKASQDWQFNGVESIISYPHDVIGPTHCTQIATYFQNPFQTETCEISSHLSLLWYFHDDKEFLAEYVNIQKECVSVKELLDLAEEFYRFVFKIRPYHKELKRASPSVLNRTIRDRSYDTTGMDDLEDIQVKENMACRFGLKMSNWLSKERKETHMDLVDKIAMDIASDESIYVKYLKFISKVKCNRIFSKLGLIEHGPIDVLRNQYDSCLLRFSTGSFVEEMRILGAYEILTRNHEPFQLFPNIRALLAVSALSIFRPEMAKEKERLIEKHGQYKKLFRHFHPKDISIFVADDDITVICQDLKNACIANNFDEILVSTYYTIYYDTHSHLVDVDDFSD